MCLRILIPIQVNCRKTREFLQGSQWTWVSSFSACISGTWSSAVLANDSSGALGYLCERTREELKQESVKAWLFMSVSIVVLLAYQHITKYSLKCSTCLSLWFALLSLIDSRYIMKGGSLNSLYLFLHFFYTTWGLSCSFQNCTHVIVMTPGWPSLLKSFVQLCSKCSFPQKILKTISKRAYWFDLSHLL